MVLLATLAFGPFLFMNIYDSKIFVGRKLRHATHVEIMLIKRPNKKLQKFTWKWFKRGAVVAFVVEGICFVAGYTIWHKINTERGKSDTSLLIFLLYRNIVYLDFRWYLRNNYPSALELYYRAGELFGSKEIRSVDLTYWEAEPKKSA